MRSIWSRAVARMCATSSAVSASAARAMSHGGRRRLSVSRDPALANARAGGARRTHAKPRHLAEQALGVGRPVRPLHEHRREQDVVVHPELFAVRARLSNAHVGPGAVHQVLVPGDCRVLGGAAAPGFLQAVVVREYNVAPHVGKRPPLGIAEVHVEAVVNQLRGPAQRQQKR